MPFSFQDVLNLGALPEKAASGWNDNYERGSNMRSGYLYALGNHGFPRYIKIGKTNYDVSERVRQLDRSTSVPTPFTFIYSSLVSDSSVVERLVHNRLAGYRMPRKEFFCVPIERAISIISEVCSSFLCTQEEFHKHLDFLSKRRETIFRRYGGDNERQQKLLGSVLRKAILRGTSHRYIEKLLESGADPNYCDDQEVYPTLLLAVDMEDVEAVRLLLEAGANLNMEDSRSGITPLFRAVQRGNFEIVRMLIGYGSSLYHINNDGISLKDAINNEEIRGFLNGFN
ncbi:GIY-YIG nuclease family protein [Methylomagnum sp.]